MTQYLYLIKCQQYYKIGVAVDVESRLAALQTGNPFPLIVSECYAFQNAEIVEKAIHQKFSKVRTRGEWFQLNENTAEKDFCEICSVLGGQRQSGHLPLTDEYIDEAEEIQDNLLNDGKWDYDKMFADGWRIETTGKGRYWQWRERKHNGKTIYGGKVADLPYPIEEMRSVHEIERTRS